MISVDRRRGIGMMGGVSRPWRANSMKIEITFERSALTLTLGSSVAPAAGLSLRQLRWGVALRGD